MRGRKRKRSSFPILNVKAKEHGYGLFMVNIWNMRLRYSKSSKKSRKLCTQFTSVLVEVDLQGK